MLDVAQVRIAGDDIVRLSFQGAGDKHVVFGVGGDAVDVVKPLSGYGMFDDHGEELVNIGF